MKIVLQIFFGAKGTRPFVVLLCLLLASVAEGVGISSLLPVITELSGGVQENSSSFNLAVRDAVRSVGIEPTVSNLLILIIGGLTLKAILTFAAMSYVGYAVAHVATSLRTLEHEFVQYLYFGSTPPWVRHYTRMLLDQNADAVTARPRNLGLSNTLLRLMDSRVGRYLLS